MIKLFISIPIPENIKTEIKLLDGEVTNCKWVNKNNLHFTVKYLGEVSQKEYWRIRNILSDIVFNSFDIKVENVGYFAHRKHPKALWAGIPKSRELCEFKNIIESALIDEPIIQSPHHFRPHITIARMKNAKYEDVAKFLKKNSLYESESIHVNEFQLMSSHQGSDGVHYNIEGTYQLEDYNVAS